MQQRFQRKMTTIIRQQYKI